MPKVSGPILAFRVARANELEELAKYANKYHIDISSNHFFRNAIKLLKDEEYLFRGEDGKESDVLWGYAIENLSLPIIPVPRHTFPSLRQLNLQIRVQFLADYRNWQKMKDPSCLLNVEIKLVGVTKDDSKSCLASYHFDRHAPKEEIDPSEEVHPLYHIQFSSAKIRKEPEAKSRSSDFDNSAFLFSDTPRLTHYPMEFILGMDFIVANYLPYSWRALQKTGPYQVLCRKYQKAFWKPYVHAIARRLDIHADREFWEDNKSIWPNIL
jgi:hypothetical protein